MALLRQMLVGRAEAPEAAAGAEHVNLQAVVVKVSDFHHLLADANYAADTDRLERLARLQPDRGGALVHVAEDGAIGVHPLVAREEGDRLVAQDQDDAEGGEDGKQAAGEEPQLNHDFKGIEALLQIQRLRLAPYEMPGQVQLL